MTTQLTRFTQWARENPQRKYNSLSGMLFDPAGLNESFERQATNKAPGVDGVRKADYGGDGLPARLDDLSARVRRLGYRPKPVRRVFIPKSNGGRRALGIPIFEDRIVQDRTSLIVQAIWDPSLENARMRCSGRRNAECHSDQYGTDHDFSSFMKAVKPVPVINVKPLNKRSTIH